MLCFNPSCVFSFDDGDFDDAEEDEGLDDLENVEDVRRLWIIHFSFHLKRSTSHFYQYASSNVDCAPFYQEDQENVQILPAGEGQQANQKRITTPYMTKYERARVLGTRALQIA